MLLCAKKNDVVEKVAFSEAVRADDITSIAKLKADYASQGISSFMVRAEYVEDVLYLRYLPLVDPTDARAGVLRFKYPASETVKATAKTEWYVGKSNEALISTDSICLYTYRRLASDYNLKLDLTDCGAAIVKIYEVVGRNKTKVAEWSNTTNWPGTADYSTTYLFGTGTYKIVLQGVFMRQSGSLKATYAQ